EGYPSFSIERPGKSVKRRWSKRLRMVRSSKGFYSTTRALFTTLDQPSGVKTGWPKVAQGLGFSGPLDHEDFTRRPPDALFGCAPRKPALQPGHSVSAHHHQVAPELCLRSQNRRDQVFFAQDVIDVHARAGRNQVMEFLEQLPTVGLRLIGGDTLPIAQVLRAERVYDVKQDEAGAMLRGERQGLGESGPRQGRAVCRMEDLVRMHRASRVKRREGYGRPGRNSIALRAVCGQRNAVRQAGRYSNDERGRRNCARLGRMTRSGRLVPSGPRREIEKPPGPIVGTCYHARIPRTG